MYLCIIKALIPVVRTNGKFQPIDGRNDYVKTAHSDARQAFLLWQSNSQPRFGPICDIMNQSRARIKQCLRFCKSNEDNNVLASIINSVTCENSITTVWYDHYYKLLNSNGNTSNQPYVESIMNDFVHSQPVFSRFSALDVKHAINKLKMGKSAGTDSMQGEYFKYAHSKVTFCYYRE